MESASYSCQSLTKQNFLDVFFTNPIKVHENPSSGSRGVPFGETDGRTDMTKPIVAFRDVTKASKNKFVEINSIPIFDIYGGYIFPTTFIVFSFVLLF